MDKAFVYYPAQTYRHGVRCYEGNKIVESNSLPFILRLYKSMEPFTQFLN